MIPSAPASSRPAGESPENVTTVEDERTQKIVREAKDKGLEIVSILTRILAATDASYGPVFNTVMTPQSGIVAVSFLLSGNLHSPREEDMLLEIMKILVRCSRQRNLVKGVTHMLLKTAVDQAPTGKDAETPAGGVSVALVDRLRTIVEDLAWEKSDYKSFSSQYPNQVKIKEDPELDLSHLLDKWANLAIQEEGEEEDEEE